MKPPDVGRNGASTPLAVDVTPSGTDEGIRAAAGYSIFSKLELSEERDVHQRVKAALVYLSQPHP
jgi:hypothetical protein